MAKDIYGFREALDSGEVLPFAHRGAACLAPENTFAAFTAATTLGFRCLETDVQASSDGVLYAFHDASLKRLTGEDHNIGALTAADIDSLRIDNTNAIPRLTDLFEAFPEALFNLDAKTATVTEPLALMIRAQKAEHRVCIGSFSDARIRATLRHLPEGICHSIGTQNTIRFFLGFQSGMKLGFSACCVQLPRTYRGIPLVTPRSVAYAKRLGLKMHVWTVNAASEMRDLLDMGVDGIMTDDCALLRQVMTERGLWQVP